MPNGKFYVEKHFHCHCNYCGFVFTLVEADMTKPFACPWCRGRQLFEETQIEECGRGVKEAAHVSEACPERGGGSIPLDRTNVLLEVRTLLQEWIDKQGHEQCWYYPEIFRKLCEILEVTITKSMNLPPRAEFGQECRRYEKEVYEQQDNLLPPVSHVEDDSNGNSGADKLDS